MEKHTKAKRILCLVLALLMLLSIGAPILFAFAETPAERLERLKQELEELQAETERVKDNKEKAEQTKQYYQAQANNLKAQLAAIKEDIAAQIESINLKNAEVAEKAATVLYQKEMFEQRLRGMYELSRQSNLAILFGIDDLSQMLRFSENLQQITERDTELVEQLRTEQALLEEQRTELEAQLEALAAREQELTDTAVAYSNAIQQADAAITAAQADLLAKEEQERDLREQQEQAQREWEAWARAEQVDFEFDGEFMWPIPGFYSLSSDFGTTRVIYGVRDVHRGMDVPAPAGTPIYAAADGVVSTNNHWSYGISVKLSHGNGVATIYGHMSQRFVNNGDYVTQGQLIGQVGSTGNSTGNHLHFEVNVNNTPVSAWPYLKKDA